MRYDRVVTTGPTGTILRIARYAIHDGPGIRTSVFFKGCPLRCWWCHSPESQALRPELDLRPDRCARCEACLAVCPEHAIQPDGNTFTTDRDLCRRCGTCVSVCPTGAREIAGVTMTVDGLMAEVEKDVLFFDESGGGVTFSGGEPLMQPVFLEAVLRRSRASRIHTAVDTCGFAEPGTFARIAGLADLVLFDLKVIDDARHREVTGVSNALILENLRALGSRSTSVRVRFPLVPGVTDDRANVEALASVVREAGLRRVDVLPYHRAGLAKYDRFDLEYRLAMVQPPSEAEVALVVATLERAGLEPQVGG